MRSTLDETSEAGLFALFKGDSGEGKTTGALSFPNVYSFDFDQKLPGIARKHFPEKEIHYDFFSDIFQVQDKIMEFHEYCPYETLLADSFTSLANLVISSAAMVKGESVPEILKRVQETKSKNKQIEMMTIDYYNAEDRFCVWFIEYLKLLWAKPGNPKHVIVTAHVITTESSPDLKTKYVTRTRSIVSKGRKVAAWLPTEFDNMYIFTHLVTGLGDDYSVKRVCLTESFGEDNAKCTMPFPQEIDFTNANLYDLMFPAKTL